jgi:hypothetical protein
MKTTFFLNNNSFKLYKTIKNSLFVIVSWFLDATFLSIQFIIISEYLINKSNVSNYVMVNYVLQR